MKTLKVDLNSDLGEGYPYDKALLENVSSANIACGYHAGDASLMRKTVRMALDHNVAIGAHPGLPDRENFGRKKLKVSPQEVKDMVLYQIGALYAIAKSEGANLHHVKPHGALYNMAAADVELATAIVDAIYSFNPKLVIYGLAGSKMIEAAKELGLPYAQEVFADRSYQHDGSLTPRELKNAVLTDHKSATDQAVRMVREGKTSCLQGHDIELTADTICIHGDTPDAVIFAKALKSRLINEGIAVQQVHFHNQKS